MLGDPRVAKMIFEEVTEIRLVEGTGANLAAAAVVSQAFPLGYHSYFGPQHLWNCTPLDAIRLGCYSSRGAFPSSFLR